MARAAPTTTGFASLRAASSRHGGHSPTSSDGELTSFTLPDLTPDEATAALADDGAVPLVIPEHDEVVIRSALGRCSWIEYEIEE